MNGARYSRWTGAWWDALNLEDLLGQLADFLLASGFNRAFDSAWGEEGMDLEDLSAALLQALMEMGHLSEQDLKAWWDEEDSPRAQELRRMLQEIMERLEREGFLSLRSEARPDREPGWAEEEERESPATPVRVEITNKTVDFLGFKTLKDLLASLGKSSVGQHDTHHLSTGIEAALSSKPYEFGDTLTLDVPATLLHAIRREGLTLPLPLEEEDLYVHQSEYTSSCATALLLDCSHSMILYGEDRFTPAKRVALALTHLIRTHYPGDSLHVILFHDTAEAIPLTRLARAQVGPYYTNTQEGLRLARRLLLRERKEMRQIIMVTDGKPSVITLPDGRLYKNPAGLDPWILRETFREVAECRKAGILVNTFMLARDRDLVGFVQKVTEICRGKAYFTTPMTLGRYVLMDYMAKKSRRIH